MTGDDTIDQCESQAHAAMVVPAAKAGGAAEPSRAAETSEELTTYADFLRIALEVINLTLTMGLSSNEHLIYALLERQAIFAPLRSHTLFGDLIENIDLVLTHFGAGSTLP